MTVATFFSLAVHASLAMLLLAMLLTVIRVIAGPTVADRVLALDQLVAIAIGFIALIAIKTGFDLYIDIALALALVGFLSTAAFARYIYVTGRNEADSEQAQGQPGADRSSRDG
ncbi:cation:proton antiporter [Rhizobium sp. KVB221]|uniref:Cation:proton antiporter n=1 Tax=Rhizobium setariae TaxID=2801340 RepID=A0A936YIP1_9HYPH|nr:cation:proton antiporter [Rhizobium setariae]MBL0370994.1 cation:proton antiporter [Rhizobium setariae]